MFAHFSISSIVPISFKCTFCFSSIKNTFFEKEKAKKFLFNILRENLKKLNKEYLFTTLNWLEQESISNDNHLNSNNTEIKKQNESYKQLYSFLENNTDIKLKSEYIAKNNLESKLKIKDDIILEFEK